MMNTPRLAAQFLAFALFDTAQLAARSFILSFLLLAAISVQAGIEKPVVSDFFGVSVNGY
jgi:hypothetical protein